VKFEAYNLKGCALFLSVKGTLSQTRKMTNFLEKIQLWPKIKRFAMGVSKPVGNF